MIIGLTGTLGSGKTTIAQYLKNKSFQYITISDLVREEAQKRNLPIERQVLQDIGNEMRKLHGNEYWAKKVLERINLNDKWIIDGIRNPGEIEELKKLKQFILVGIDAPLKIRLDRIQERKGILSERKHSDPNSIDEIKKLEERDRGLNESSFGQHVEKCLELADYKISTDMSEEETFRIVNEIIQKVKNISLKKLDK